MLPKCESTVRFVSQYSLADRLDSVRSSWDRASKRKSLMDKLGGLVLLGGLVVNVVVTIGLTFVSVHNYPGGEAIEALRRVGATSGRSGGLQIALKVMTISTDNPLARQNCGYSCHRAYYRPGRHDIPSSKMTTVYLGGNLIGPKARACRRPHRYGLPDSTIRSPTISTDSYKTGDPNGTW